MSQNIYVQANESNGFGIAGLTFSILGWLTCGLLCPLGFMLSLIGVFKEPRGTSVAGLIVGGLGSTWLFLFGFAFIAAILGIGAGTAAVVEEMERIQAEADLDPLVEPAPVDAIAENESQESTEVDDAVSSLMPSDADREARRESEAVRPKVEPPPKPESTPRRGSQVVNKQHFAALSTGMSYEDAVEIIGSNGELLSSNNIAGVSTSMYSWKNPFGSNMTAMFQNGKLIQKSQFGLPPEDSYHAARRAKLAAERQRQVDEARRRDKERKDREAELRANPNPPKYKYSGTFNSPSSKSPSREQRGWIVDGKKVDATYGGLIGSKVILKLPDGKKIRPNVSDLGDADRQYLEELKAASRR